MQLNSLAHSVLKEIIWNSKAVLVSDHLQWSAQILQMLSMFLLSYFEYVIIANITSILCTLKRILQAITEILMAEIFFAAHSV